MLIDGQQITLFRRHALPPRTFPMPSVYLNAAVLSQKNQIRNIHNKIYQQRTNLLVNGQLPGRAYLLAQQP